jgi:hypothetical protein
VKHAPQPPVYVLLIDVGSWIRWRAGAGGGALAKGGAGCRMVVVVVVVVVKGGVAGAGTGTMSTPIERMHLGPHQ